MIRRGLFGVVLLLGLTLHGRDALSETVYEDTVEPYVVRSGDTISHITHRMLGDSLFWRDNWKLNPQVRDPDKLRIGQVLQIIVKRKVIAESAQVIEAVNVTEKMLQASRWQPASKGDRLESGQGLRTRKNSTAELRFNESSRLTLGEFSQVFLARKDTSLRGVERGSIKVEQGTVDLVFAPLKADRSSIEVIAGPATARPMSSAAGGSASVRTGVTADGGAKVMVFGGRSEVAAGGSALTVDTGMGTRVPESGPPANPEKLLPAPRIDAALQSWNYNNGLLRWQGIEGASGYALKVCLDADCRQLLQSASIDAPNTAHQVAELPAGKFHWQVMAISASGLDGYAATAEMEITDATPDLEGPMIALRPVSGVVDGIDGSTRLGPQAMVMPQGFDERSGFAHFEVRDTQGAWQPWDGAPIAVGSLRGQTLLIAAVDRLGHRTEMHLVVGAESAAP